MVKRETDHAFANHGKVSFYCVMLSLVALFVAVAVPAVDVAVAVAVAVAVPVPKH